MLLFCVKHTRLDIVNPVRELSKMLGVATVAAMKEMKRVVKHVLDAMSLGLKIEPELTDDGKWKMAHQTIHEGLECRRSVAKAEG